MVGGEANMEMHNVSCHLSVDCPSSNVVPNEASYTNNKDKNSINFAPVVLDSHLIQFKTYSKMAK